MSEVVAKDAELVRKPKLPKKRILKEKKKRRNS
jgi:hypothetical protein